MKPRFYLLALLVSPAWCQTPPVERVTAASFDLRSDAVRKIVSDTAATQSAVAQAPLEVPVETRRTEIAFEPGEKPPKPVGKINLPEPAPTSNGFLSSLFDILVSELAGSDDVTDIDFANQMLRCRVQKDQKSSPPGPDNCPIAD